MRHIGSQAHHRAQHGADSQHNADSQHGADSQHNADSQHAFHGALAEHGALLDAWLPSASELLQFRSGGHALLWSKSRVGDRDALRFECDDCWHMVVTLEPRAAAPPAVEPVTPPAVEPVTLAPVRVDTETFTCVRAVPSARSELLRFIDAWTRWKARQHAPKNETPSTGLRLQKSNERQTNAHPPA